MQNIAIWIVAALALAGVIVRPWRIPEWVFAAAGAMILLLCGLLHWHDAALALGKAADVCMFLAGMMLLSELARREGLFDFLAAYAVNRARGSASRMFAMTYAIGILITTFMSNDATAIMLTPAVAAAARRAHATPLPFLFVCAFIANAAGFVLPISNPANLVIYGAQMLPLQQWIATFALPSLMAIAATFAMHRLLHRNSLIVPILSNVPLPVLSRSMVLVGVGILGVAVALLIVSYHGTPLGMPTLIAGCVVALIMLVHKREGPMELFKDVPWGVLVLVAALFVLVEGLARTGLVDEIGAFLHHLASRSPMQGAAIAATATAFATNLCNNLPLGLIMGSAIAELPTTAAQTVPLLRAAITLGIDLGPNLSVTGSLATILWLVAIRREGENVSGLQFLRLGVVVMPLALLAALAGLLIAHTLWI